MLRASVTSSKHRNASPQAASVAPDAHKRVTQPGEHALGGPAALKFTGEVNSDIEDGRLKPDAPPEQLYDLSRDPSQTRNVIREYPEVAARLKARLEVQAQAPTTAPKKPPRRRV